MKVRLRYFAAIREAVECTAEERDTVATTVAALRDELIARSPAHAEVLSRGRAVRVAVDQVMVDETVSLHEGCEVAFFPPVTGG